MAGVRGLCQDRFHVVDEAHAQHFVGFVQYQRLEAVQLQCALAEVIQHSARGAHDHLGTAAQALDLREKVLAAIDRQNVEVAELAGIGGKRFGHLDGQFPRGCQNQDLWFHNRRVYPAQQRQRKGGGFTGTRLGNAQ